MSELLKNEVNEFSKTDTRLLKNIESLLIENNNLLRQALFSDKGVEVNATKTVESKPTQDANKRTYNKKTNGGKK